MKPLQRAIVPQSEVELVIADLIRKWNDGNAGIRRAFAEAATQAEAAKAIREYTEAEYASTEVWMNDEFQVAVRQFDDGRLVHLSIKTQDRRPCHDWRAFQQIKNQLVGPECEGVELYPAESRLVDSANSYHLYVVPDQSYRFPFGFTERLVSEESVGKSVNRPFEKEPKQNEDQKSQPA